MTGIKIAMFLAMVMGMLPIGVDDAAATCAEVKVLGYKVIRETGAMKYGCSIIAFVVPTPSPPNPHPGSTSRDLTRERLPTCSEPQRSSWPSAVSR